MTWFDGLLIGVLILSIGFAVVRGAVREIATLAAVGGGALLAFLSFNPLLGAFGLAGSFFGMVALAGALLGGFFLVLYIAFHFGLQRMELSPDMARVNRIGGGFFGLARGLALIGLSFLGYAYYLDEPRRPEAVNSAFLLPVAQNSAKFFEGFAPVYDDQSVLSADELDDKLNAASDGYNRGDREALSEIVTTTTTTDGAKINGASEEDALADILQTNGEPASNNNAATDETNSEAEDEFDGIADILSEDTAGDY